MRNWDHKCLISLLILKVNSKLRKFFMPKMKTKSSAKKRFKVLGNGKIKRPKAFKRHLLTKKSTKAKRQMRGTTMVHRSNLSAVAQMLPYSK